MEKAPVRLVLVTPEIPANVGNIVRLCAVTAVPLHVVEPCGFRWDDRLLKRAGLDYWPRCRLERHLEFEELERLFPHCNFWFLSARAERSFFDVRISHGDVLALGPESSGLSERFLSKNGRRSKSCRLPMPGGGRSLNLATAAGIVVYESLRQLGLLEGA
ncbi:MAG: tRNA (cytidine(34)-2'-O)-methyltransferase [Deltaproteobacteria bacterium]|nr:MAG: tRNA (cytidine(34)-2'-O)-methyltransferase [Deltaproteobacteria bacterium]